MQYKEKGADPKPGACSFFYLRIIVSWGLTADGDTDQTTDTVGQGSSYQAENDHACSGVEHTASGHECDRSANDKEPDGTDDDADHHGSVAAQEDKG